MQGNYKLSNNVLPSIQPLSPAYLNCPITYSHTSLIKINLDVDQKLNGSVYSQSIREEASSIFDVINGIKVVIKDDKLDNNNNTLKDDLDDNDDDDDDDDDDDNHLDCNCNHIASDQKDKEKDNDNDNDDNDDNDIKFIVKDDYKSRLLKKYQLQRSLSLNKNEEFIENKDIDDDNNNNNEPSLTTYTRGNSSCTPSPILNTDNTSALYTFLNNNIDDYSDPDSPFFPMQDITYFTQPPTPTPTITNPSTTNTKQTNQSPRYPSKFKPCKMLWEL